MKKITLQVELEIDDENLKEGLQDEIEAKMFCLSYMAWLCAVPIPDGYKGPDVCVSKIFDPENPVVSGIYFPERWGKTDIQGVDMSPEEMREFFIDSSGETKNLKNLVRKNLEKD